MTRIGVFLCDCGGQISAVLDTEALAWGVRELPGVALAHRLPFSCSLDGLEMIRRGIADEGLDRVVVGGCTWRTMKPRFLKLLDGGVALEIVDLREGCARVHRGDPPGAMAKAMDMLRMGVAKAALMEPYEPVVASVLPAALVIGGGLAGMTAARALADNGVPVTLVERAPALGGMLRQVHDAEGLLGEHIQAMTSHPRINVLLESEVAEVAGTAGHYTVTVKRSTGQRGNEAPGQRVGENDSLTLDVGAIVVATGAQVQRPVGRFRYDGRLVVTQLEFERELVNGYAGESAKVVMLLCAGSRDEATPYCSAVCCLWALQQALAVKGASPGTDVTVLFRDLFLLGDDRYRDVVRRARKAGVRFVRYRREAQPRIAEEAIEITDGAGNDHRVAYDRLVLATPLVPQDDAPRIARLLGLPRDEHGFFADSRYRLRPEEAIERGIYVAGAAHHPTGWDEAEFQAYSAALRALRHLQKGTIVSRAPLARVDELLCTGCGSCVEVCAFGAIAMWPRTGLLDVSHVDPLLCKGCGNCIVACPSKAITMPVEGDAQLLAQISAALASVNGDGRPRVLAFGCQWSGHAAAELAGARGLQYPADVRLIRVRCSARFDSIHILWAFLNGAAGVFLGACPPGKCHYVDGNRYAEERVAALKGMLAEGGFDVRRLRLEWITPDDPEAFVELLSDFAAFIAALEGLPSAEGKPVYSFAKEPSMC